MEPISIIHDVFLVPGTGLAPHGQLGWNLGCLDLLVDATRDLDASSITTTNALVDCVLSIYTKVKEQQGRFFLKVIASSSNDQPSLQEYWEQLSVEKSHRLIAKCVVAAVAKKHGIPISATLKQQQQQQAVNKVMKNHEHVLTCLLDRLSLASSTTSTADDDCEKSTCLIDDPAKSRGSRPPIVVSSFDNCTMTRDDENGSDDDQVVVSVQQHRYAQAVLKNLVEKQHQQPPEMKGAF